MLGTMIGRAIFKSAFSGKLVEQNPNDEPASLLLERVRAERASGPARNRGFSTHKQPPITRLGKG
jgi:type I restriction enzyme S subunit